MCYFNVTSCKLSHSDGRKTKSLFNSLQTPEFSMKWKQSIFFFCLCISLSNAGVAFIHSLCLSSQGCMVYINASYIACIHIQNSCQHQVFLLPYVNSVYRIFLFGMQQFFSWFPRTKFVQLMLFSFSSASDNTPV